MPVRIFGLAKELEISSKELIDFLKTQGHVVTSHMSTLSDTVAQILRDRYKPKAKPKEKPAPEKAPVKGKAAPGMNGGPGTVAGRDAAQRGGRPAGPPVAAERGPKFGPDAPRGGWTGAPGTRPAAAAAAGPAETDAEREKRLKEKREEPPATRKRFFPSKEDIYGSGPRFGGGKRKMMHRPKSSRDGGQAAGSTTVLQRPEKVEVALPITVKALSSLMGLKAPSILKFLMEHNHPVHINQFLDEELVSIVSVESGIDVLFKQRTADVEDAVRKLEEAQATGDDLKPRAPVVTFLGHVDHGKTSLLDKIRETKVTQKEAGGITQHIGAYRVDRGKAHVVFIDTPGHQAFTEMRARGANVTDVAVLVVAADDGVMPQTEEALNHARAAKVPIVVAINKVDKPTANVLRAKQQLMKLGLSPVEWGGDTEFVEVSALTGQGLDNLLETLSLTSDILELKADAKRPALGVVLEAEASTSRGVLATVLVREGTLRAGDYVLCGPAHGRIKGLWLNGIKPVKEAGPATPVKITGLNLVPEAGEKFYVFEDTQQARSIAESRERKQRELDRAGRQQITQENILSTLTSKGKVEEVRVILKTDVRGSLEALGTEIESLSTPEVKVKILHKGVGAISQADVGLAHASQAMVIGFSVTADERARGLADEKKVEIRVYDIIYKAVDDIRLAMQDRLAPQLHEEVRGHAEIRQIYKASKVGNIAGCIVTDGVIGRNDKVRLVRDGRIVTTGTLSSLKRFKDDAREVKESFECGIKISDYNDIKVGDVVEAFTIVERARKL